MFASLSSLLPSSFQQAAQGSRPPVQRPQSPTAPPDAPTADPPRRKERKEKHANEAFIIVRPPPKSSQALSLQVQLVPPQSRLDKPLQALDSSPDNLNTDLKRTHSNGSEASATSGYASASSVSSFASTSTSSSGRRMIIPLYNLNVYAMMPTTILDAGTDAKVAKFAKRGLEVVGLAFLEPIEVRPSATAYSSLAPPPSNVRVSFDGSLLEFGSSPSPRSVSPSRPNTSHATVRASDPSKPIVNVIPAPPLPPPDYQPQRSTKRLFAKVLRKKDPVSPSIAVSFPSDIGSRLPPLRKSSLRSDDATAPYLDDAYNHDSLPSSPLSSTTASQMSVLGVHPTLYPPVNNPKGRPTKYIWVVRKWLKGAETGILNGMMGKLNASARDTDVSNMPHIEVRFEWSREQKKENVRKSRANKSSNSRDNYSPSRRSSMPNSTLPRFSPQTLAPGARDHRSSIISQNSSGSETAASLISCGVRRNAVESDEESDPEDSDTPWTCMVVVRRLGQPPQHHQNGVRESAIRIKVATLAPTPHHPKVVGLLKIPFPLPDIEVEQLAVRRRQVTARGISKTTSKAGEFVLTAEEIKDTVSSTALWLVVREAFGGVGKERKRGKS